MRSRGTTYLLLAAVAVVWGVVVWKIFMPDSEATPAAQPSPAAVKPAVSEADTLQLDYPDPFLKGVAVQNPSARTVVRALSPAPKVRRERVNILHLGTVTSKGRTFHILTVGNEQYEIRNGETAAEFVLDRCDKDSLYFTKQGIIYGIKQCE